MGTESDSPRQGEAPDGAGAYPEVAVVPWPAQVDAAAFHGPAGDFVRIIAPHTETDPMALLISLLVGMGVLIGRTTYFVAEADRHYTNLFAVVVGLSGKGRKGSSYGHIERLLKRLDSDFVETRISKGLSSGEGLIWAVRDPIEKTEAVREKGRTVGFEQVVSDAGVSDKRLLCLEPEFAGVLRVLERDGNTLSAVVRGAWDSGRLSVLTKSSPARATAAHIAILGHVTRDELRRYLNRTEAGNGFGNRFLWVCSRRARILPEGGSLDPAVLEPVAADLQRALEFAEAERELRRDEAARARWYEVYPALSEGQPGLFGALTGRAEAQVMRLACLYAVLDCSPCIRRQHLEAALAVWRYCEESARFIFGGVHGHPLADEIQALLQARPDGLTRAEISAALSRHRAAREVAEALTFLAEGGLAHVEREPTAGRTAERWHADALPAAPRAGAPPLAPGVRVQLGRQAVTLTRLHPPDAQFPAGRAEVVTDDGQVGEIDLRGVQRDGDG